jgi:ankyrin repeat protein
MALAIRLNFTDAVESLIRHKANVNAPNRSGETPLIIAVQLDKPQIVRLLIKAGANPDITDNLAGLSARDYATRDPRKKHILSILEGTEAPEAAKTEKQGELDFSGFEEVK